MYELRCRVTKDAVLRFPATGQTKAREYAMNYVAVQGGTIIPNLNTASISWDSETVMRVIGQAKDGTALVRFYVLEESTELSPQM